MSRKTLVVSLRIMASDIRNMALIVYELSSTRHRDRRHCIAFICLLWFMAGCAVAPTPQGIQDPNETANRSFHAFNKGVDTALLRPASKSYGAIVPRPVRNGVNNFSENLGTPGDVVNNILQGRIDKAGQNSLRFAVNLTAGLGGILDAATWLGVPEAKTDFGETLHVWGAGEGNYIEAPLIGPTTTRDLVGKVVDTVLDPLQYALEAPESNQVAVAGVAATIGDRAKFGETVDSVLYDSADSYAQLRQLYLDNRRFELGQAVGDDAFIDPYEDENGQ
jgi:phospholipid-binding lipoprotein MlaA